MTLPLKPFYFIRHGETDWNVQKILMGSKDIPLNENGKAQATFAQKLLNNLEIGQVFSSPSQRAKQTAAILNKKQNHPLQHVEQFKERGWGEWEGKQRPETFKQEDTPIPVGAEPFPLFKLRVMSTLEVILKTEKHPPLIVSHGGVFMAIDDSIGHSNFEAKNCALYHCLPPKKMEEKWVISELS